MKTSSLILLFLFNLSLSFSQNPDSLFAIYKNKNLSDSLRIEALHRTAYVLLDYNPDSAFTLFSIELSYATKIGNSTWIANSLNNLSIYYNNKGNILKSTQYKKEALAIYIENNDSSKIARMYLNIGSDYHKIDKFELALINFQKAKEGYEELGIQKGVAQCTDNIGIIYSDLKNYKKALENYQEALQLRLKENSPYKAAISQSNIGFLYNHLLTIPTSEVKLIIPFKSNDSLEISNSIFDSSIKYHRLTETEFFEHDKLYDLSYTFLGIGELFFNVLNYDSSLFYYKKANTLAIDLNIHHNRIQTSHALSEVYEKLLYFDSSLFWLRVNLDLKKDLFDENKQFELGGKMAANLYDIEKKHNEEIHKLVLKEEQERTRYLFTIAIIIFIVAILLFIIFYFKTKLKRQEEFSKGAIDGTEKERKRLAIELHDDIGQQLTMIKSTCTNSGNQEIKTRINKCIDSIKSFSRDLYPVFITTVGLNGALDELTNRLENSSNLHISHELNKELDDILNNNQKLNIYRIIQECINNTIKHANATSIRITSSLNNNTITFIYKDNGIGIKSNSKKGIGSYSTNERVKILSGEITHKKVPKGVEIRFTIPIIIK